MLFPKTIKQEYYNDVFEFSITSAVTGGSTSETGNTRQLQQIETSPENEM